MICVCHIIVLSHEFVFLPFRGEIFDTDLSPFSSLRFIRFEGKCNRGGTLLLLYYFDVPTDCFEQHLQANMDHDHNAQ